MRSPQLRNELTKSRLGEVWACWVASSHLSAPPANEASAGQEELRPARPLFRPYALPSSSCTRHQAIPTVNSYLGELSNPYSREEEGSDTATTSTTSHRGVAGASLVNEVTVGIEQSGAGSVAPRPPPEFETLVKRFCLPSPSTEVTKYLFEGPLQCIEQPQIELHRENETMNDLLRTLGNQGDESGICSSSVASFVMHAWMTLCKAEKRCHYFLPEPTDQRSGVSTIEVSELPRWVRDEPWKASLIVLAYPMALSRDVTSVVTHPTLCLKALSEGRRGTPTTMTRWLAEVMAYPPHPALQIEGRPIQSDEERFERLANKFDEAAMAGRAQSVLTFIKHTTLLGLEDHFNKRYEVAVRVPCAPESEAMVTIANPWPNADIRLRSRCQPAKVFRWTIADRNPPFLLYTSGAGKHVPLLGLDDPQVGLVTYLPASFEDPLVTWDSHALHDCFALDVRSRTLHRLRNPQLATQWLSFIPKASSTILAVIDAASRDAEKRGHLLGWRLGRPSDVLLPAEDLRGISDIFKIGRSLSLWGALLLDFLRPGCYFPHNAIAPTYGGVRKLQQVLNTARADLQAGQWTPATTIAGPETDAARLSRLG